MKIIKKMGSLLGILLLLLLASFLYLNRGLPHEIKPAEFECLSLKEGTFVDFDTLPSNTYGIGLSYAGHINETASEFDPEGDPPVFIKASNSITKNGSQVKIPSHQTMLDAVEQLEPGINQKLNEQFKSLPALLDYEVELGFVLLEDILSENLNNADYIPKIGFFIGNDLSARSLAVLGEGQANRYDYWGISKSFLGFTPISDKVWIPNEFKANSIPCIMIETQVNGVVRQHQMTNDMIYTPLQMLQAIQRKYPNKLLQKGDMVLTGTPGGVMMSTPRWLVRLAAMVGMDRFKKLSKVISDEEKANKFLKAGDKVLVKGEGLGSVEVEIVE
ncbi:MAG: fumarylacetoacetate hydrolase family protein [Ignavibacteria bacterium]|nr:fumarylacetoacetate hydrolase family protein [Ignavibacteria bacterium]